MHSTPRSASWYSNQASPARLKASQPESRSQDETGSRMVGTQFRDGMQCLSTSAAPA